MTAVHPTSPKDFVLARIYAPIASELEEVETILKQEMRSEHAEVDELVRYGWRLGGKRLRPALLLLSGKATGEVRRDHLVLAAVVEMVHTATLIHDDVLDNANTRRRLPTVNSRWDNEASVLLGDFLFSHAFYLASTLESTYPCRLIGQATNTVCEGEMRQKISRGDFALSEQRYYEIINAKTAALCECSSQLGAFCSGADKETEARLQRFGQSLGMAFQIVDDLLDLVRDDDVAGKTLGTDLEQQIPTLPIIRTLEMLDDNARTALIEKLSTNSPDSLEHLRSAFEETDALSFAMSKAQEYADDAQRQITDLPQSEARDVLLELTDFVVARSH